MLLLLLFLSFLPPALISFGALSVILKFDVFRAVGGWIWEQNEFLQAWAAAASMAKTPIPHPLISGRRILRYPLARGTSEIPNLAVLWLRG